MSQTLLLPLHVLTWFRDVGFNNFQFMCWICCNCDVLRLSREDFCAGRHSEEMIIVRSRTKSSFNNVYLYPAVPGLSFRSSTDAKGLPHVFFRHRTRSQILPTSHSGDCHPSTQSLSFNRSTILKRREHHWSQQIQVRALPNACVLVSA